MEIPDDIRRQLFAHLFPGDDDEHGAVLVAGMAERDGFVRFLVRELHIAQDGIDYLPGKKGYRELAPAFIGDRLADCRSRGLAYFAVHNHGGDREVAFSEIDLGSHERGYPTLLELNLGAPVGALVFAHRAAAGDVWFSNGMRLVPTEVRIVGPKIERLTSIQHSTTNAHHASFDRQILMFGGAGQELLRRTTVGVIGVGGVGSILVELLAKLGVGRLVIADPDRVEMSNLSRVVGATRWDAGWPLTLETMPLLLRSLGTRLSALKVTVAARQARRTSTTTEVLALSDNVSRSEVADRFLNCDFLFLAADSAQARLMFNAMVHQYYIPGIQIGSKIVAQGKERHLSDAFSVIRRLWPGFGCLWCAGLIPPDKLAWESKSLEEQIDQRYGTEDPAPSVITLNAVGAAHAVNQFLFSLLAIHDPEGLPWWAKRFDQLRQVVIEDYVSPLDACPECGKNPKSRLAAGGARALPISC